MFLDATYCRARVNHRVISQAMVVVISDAHSGLKKAISTVFQGAAWQRCRVHFMRNVFSIVSRASQDMAAAAIRTIFAQRDAKHIQA